MKRIRAGLTGTSVVTGTVAAEHRPAEIDRYQRYIIGTTCTQVVIEDEFLPAGNVKVDLDHALDHIAVEDGLGYTFQITESFLFGHLEHDHGWPAKRIQAFKDALDHYCRRIDRYHPPALLYWERACNGGWSNSLIHSS